MLTSIGKRAIKLVIISIVILTSPVLLQAQDIVQRIRGIVIDAATRKGIEGANVQLTHTDYTDGTVTDSMGMFELNTTPARYKIRISFTGYLTYEDELLVIAGKQTQIDVALQQSATKLEEVSVTSNASSPNIPGLQSISIEKTLRIPANFFDPVRMATSYPNIVAANDQANSIIVKGNSPNGLLWRLNDLDIVNPNHLANAGTLSDRPVANGGGVNILSAQMLDRTDFYTGAFPVQYGNALSGIFDMKLREGNTNRNEYTAQASLIGLDLSAEGPFNNNRQSSFLANYRYSTVGLLSQLGVQFGDEDIRFQDFSLNLNFTRKDGGNISFFGFYGNSLNNFTPKDTIEREFDKDKYNISYTANTYAVGTNYNKPLKTGALFFGFAYSASHQQRNSSLSNTPNVLLNEDYIRNQLLADRFDFSKSVLSSHIKYNVKVKDNSQFDLGVVANYQNDEVDSYRRIGCITCSFIVEQLLAGIGDGILLQPYAKWHAKVTSNLNVDAGIRYVNYTYNNTDALEPRVSFDYVTHGSVTYNLSYGLVSQLQLPLTYFAAGNADLDLTKAHHVEFGYSRPVWNNTKLKSELFYQYLFDVPVESDPASTFSVINLLEEFAPSNLINEGTGENYGINLTLEKFFFQKHYFLVGAGYYESKYTGGDDIKRNTRFNGNYTINGVYGKEWKHDEKNRTIGLNTRLLYLGGLRESAVDPTASEGSYESIYTNVDPFSEKLKDYFRLDLRLSFRKNKPGYTRTFAIDIQNVLNQRNEAYHYYDFTKGKIVTKYQLGIIPVLVYRIDF